MTTLVRGATLVSAGKAVDDGWVLFDDERILDVGSGAAPAADETVAGDVIAPGYVDIHCHGGGGYAFDDGAASIASAIAFHRAHGTTSIAISLVSASIDVLVERVRAAANVAQQDSSILGVHAEGPWLDIGHKGAHDASLLHAPHRSEVERVAEAASGHLAQVTLAPELPGALQAIAALRNAGVRVAVGHTDADADTTLAAFEAGASIVTHAFNGMRGLHHRESGPLLAALDRPDATIEVIADGHHVLPRMVKLLFDEAPERVALITDAMAAAGLPDGPSKLGELDVVVAGGLPRLVTTGGIAGSTLTMDRAVAVTVGAGVSLAAAIDAATRIPARALGYADRGVLELGRRADVLVLGDDLRVQRVWAANP